MNKSHITMLAAILIIVCFVQLLGYWAGNTAIFGPYMTPIFLMMGLSLWYFWKTPSDKPKKLGYLYFWGQIGFLLLWIFTFFILKSPLLALIESFLLIIFLACTINAFVKVNRLCVVLLFLYFFWALAPLALSITTWNIQSL